MPELKKISKVSDFFLNLSEREEKGVFFYRVSGYNSGIHAFIRKYYEACMISGAIVEGGIPNPDQKNLAYYNEMMGMEFNMNPNFILKSINKWLPRLNPNQKKNISDSIYNLLLSLQKSGKNEPILQAKNNLVYLSEFTKFKTELCHSWELIGTCKYGINVNKYIFI